MPDQQYGDVIFIQLPISESKFHGRESSKLGEQD